MRAAPSGTRSPEVRDDLDTDRLLALHRAVETDILENRLDGAVMLVARHGQVHLHEALGYADRDRAIAMERDTVIFTQSIAKHLTNVAVLQRIDSGEISFTTQVRDVIPEYAQHGKDSTTIADLMLHRAGLPFAPSLPPEVLGSIEATTAAVAQMVPLTVPGEALSYSATVAHSVLAELVRRLDSGKRPYRKILLEDLFVPLGMADTCLGHRADLADRRAPVVFRDRRPGLMDPDIIEAASNLPIEDLEMPAAAGLTTTRDFFRFVEAIRRGGEIDGVRILSPRLTEYALRNRTGDEPNGMWEYAQESRGWRPFPANLSLAFYLRGDGVFPHAFGQLASPSTFGGIGAGSNVFWADPETGVTFVFLATGLVEESYAWERHQRYSDLVHGAVPAA